MADPFSFAIMTVAQIGISFLFPSEGPRLKDLKVTASTYGAAIPWVFGRTRVPGNMIWSLPIKETKKKKGPGKGGFHNEYSYSCTFAMGLCRGPVTSIRKVWADGKVIYDATKNSVSGVDFQSLNPASRSDMVNIVQQVMKAGKYRMRFYMGDEDQLPDSAIVANKGESNTPAYRGLAYILFDDMPLEDFGNRIPQITVEVMVGGQQQTVGTLGFLENDGETPLDDYYAAGEAAFDFDRSFAYLRFGETLRRLSLKTAEVQQTFTNSNFNFDDGDALTKLLVATHDGSVIVVRGDEATGATSAVDRLDPYSMQSVASLEGVPTPAVAASCLTSTSVDYLLTISTLGEASLLTTADLALQASFTIGGSAATGPYRVVGRDSDASGEPVFYVLHGTGVITLTKIEADGTQTDVWTEAGIGASPLGVVWDAGHPGVIMFWTAAGQDYIAKWSEDTADEAWRKTIAGAPLNFSQQSTVTSYEFPWVHDGTLYIVNTATGDYVDKSVDPGSGEIDPNAGEVDWQDYLDRYPDVEADFYYGGYSYADSLIAYAQWDYQVYGQAAGRTLTYFSADSGQGFPLTGDGLGQDGAYQAFDSSHGALICFGGFDGIVKMIVSASGVTVGSIVERLLREGGLTTAQLDLDPLYEIEVEGYGWASGTDTKNILDELKRLYLFDLVEREGALAAVMRGDPDNGLDMVVETIKQGALGSSSLDANDFWQETRLQEADLPSSVTLAYMNIDADFEVCTARSTRISNPIPTMFSRQQVAMEINVVMNPKAAKVQTNKILYSQWTERTRHNTRLPWAYLHLDPADKVTVDFDDGRSYQERIHQTDVGADFSIDTECYSADSGAYDNWEAITIADGGSNTPGSLIGNGLAVPIILNTPLLRDQDDQAGSSSVYYVGIGNGVAADFQGATLYRSTNNIDYDPMSSSDNDVEWGTVIGTLPPPPFSPFCLDWKTELVILPSVDWFALESISDDDLWEGGNACVVGDEVIQFRDAVENEDGTWTLTNLLRGRRGSEYACDTHTAGERFVFLSNTTVRLTGDLINSRGQARYFKTVAKGRSLQETAATTIVYEPRDLMPYAPADIRRDRDTGEDLTVSWQRRNRLGGNMQDGTGEIAMSERVEQYEAYVLAAAFDGDLSRGTPPTAYLRKYTLSVPSFTYTSAEQGEDGFDPDVDDLHVVIYQLSDVVGRGFPAARTIEAGHIF